jgi:ketosteroid isomerase-like protein
MRITPEMIRKEIEKFIDLYNKQKFQKACLLYAQNAVLVNETDTVTGRDDIIDFFEECNHASITNHHIVATYIGDNGQHALVNMEFTVAHDTMGSVEFLQCCSSLLFEIHDGLLSIVSDMIMIVLRT